MELQVIDIELKEVTNKIEHLENAIELKRGQMDLIFEDTQPKPIDYSKEYVQRGKRVDKYIEYTSIVCDDPEYKKLESEVEKLEREKFIWVRYQSKELQRLDKYNEVEKLIVYYKEQYIPDKSKGEEMPTWDEISTKVHYSKSQCRNIYRKYKKLRNIDTY
jgi:hypothetical protein